MSIFKSHLYTLPAYKPPLEGRDPHKYLLLDFNERTLPMAEPIRRALVEYIESGRMQMYPAYGDIVERLAEYAGVQPDQLMVTNGSDQGIELVFRASCAAGDEVIIPQPNFAMYNQCAKVEGAKIVAPFYSKEAGFPVDACLAAITPKTRVICVANPNNPTGVGVSREAIIRLAEAAPNIAILVDECYFEYSGLTVVDLVLRYPNIVVTRTFSKTWGMPSLRMGYLIASPDNVLALLSVRGPYDVNQLAIVAAQAALSHADATLEYVREVMHDSKPALERYLDSKSVSYWPSCANYLWVFPANSELVEKHLASDGILVRPRVDQDGKRGLRITLGTREQTDRLIASLEQVL